MSNTQLAPYEDRIAEELAHPKVAFNLANAMPPWLNVEQFKAQAAIMAANPPKDRDKNPPNVLAMTTALLNCAQMGLMPGPSRHVAFVNRNGMLLAQPQWQGLQFLFDLGGWKVTTHIVHTDDVFEVESLGPDEFAVAKHSYDPFAERVFAFPDKGVRGAYAKGVNKETGEVRYRFVNMERIRRAIGATSTSRTDTPWHTDFALMVQKTVFQQAAARRWFDMPAEVVARLALAVEKDYEAAGQTPQPVAEPPRANQVAARIAAAAAPQLPAPEPAAEAPTPQPQPAAQTGWLDDKDRRWFMGELNAMGLDYEDLCAWRASQTPPKCRPSGLTAPQRKTLLAALAKADSPTAVALTAWFAARREAQAEPPVDAEPDPDGLPFFDE